MADAQSRAGARYAGSEILRFVDELHAVHTSDLDRAFAAPASAQMPAIMVGRSEGRLLWTLLRIARARRVVEIGTLAGYSALWIAKALPVDGRVFTIEADPQHARIAAENISLSPESDRITLVQGDAVRELPRLESKGPFDAVFIDADKGNYPFYGEWAARNLCAGGLLIADNAYYFGSLLTDSREAAAMRAFHAQAAKDFETACAPTPDGMLIGIRRGA